MRITRSLLCSLLLLTLAAPALAIERPLFHGERFSLALLGGIGQDEVRIRGGRATANPGWSLGEWIALNAPATYRFRAEEFSIEPGISIITSATGAPIEVALRVGYGFGGMEGKYADVNAVLGLGRSFGVGLGGTRWVDDNATELRLMLGWLAIRGGE